MLLVSTLECNLCITWCCWRTGLPLRSKTAAKNGVMRNLTMKYRQPLYLFFMASYVSALAAAMGRQSELAMWLGAPALFLSGWAFAGHLVTLDDDMPGEWSNPQGSNKLWHLSLGELSLKAVVFFALLVVVYLWAPE